MIQQLCRHYKCHVDLIAPHKKGLLANFSYCRTSVNKTPVTVAHISYISKQSCFCMDKHGSNALNLWFRKGCRFKIQFLLSYIKSLILCLVFFCYLKVKWKSFNHQKEMNRVGGFFHRINPKTQKLTDYEPFLYSYGKLSLSIRFHNISNNNMH